jgi:hypothetical protein
LPPPGGGGGGGAPPDLVIQTVQKAPTLRPCKFRYSKYSKQLPKPILLYPW